MPHLSSNRRLLGLAALVALVLAAVLCARDLRGLGVTFGDTDDATRIVLMRELAHGRGWYDQLVTRFQPPYGTWIHWSRLLDGGLALMDRAFAAVFGEARGERLTRIVWPLLWLLPAVAAALAGARRMVGRDARGRAVRDGGVLAAALIVVVYLGQLTIQFHPGRVDHHDVQIVLALISLVGAMQTGPRVRGAVIGGVATGVGLAIGLEALLFEAAFAASYGLRFWLDRTEARRTWIFGLTLSATTLVAFLAQTPPARWGVPACDALGSNLLAGAVLAGLGLAAAAWAMRNRGWPWRLAALTVAGGAALAVYLAIDPHCTKGIFADVDPRLKPFWLDHVNEVKPIAVLWKSDKADAAAVILAGAMGLASWASLGLVASRRRDPAWWVVGAALVLALAATLTAVRMRSYLEWFAVLPLAAAAAEMGARFAERRAFVTALCAVLFTPLVLTVTILVATGVTPSHLPPSMLPVLAGLVALAVAMTLWRMIRSGWRAGLGLAAIVLPLVVFLGVLALGDLRQRHKPKPRPEPADRCFDIASYAPLAHAAPGLAVGEIDLGPFILAHTPSSAMSGPYHRMSRGILLSREALIASVDDAGPTGAQARVRALGEAAKARSIYVLACPVHRNHFDRSGLTASALQKRLDAGVAPPWLEPLTDPKAGLQIYRLRPATRP